MDSKNTTDIVWAVANRPKWQDGCNHDPDSYFGSCYSKELGTMVDVYVYRELFFQDERYYTCVRYGGDVSEYLSGIGIHTSGYSLHSDNDVHKLIAHALSMRGINAKFV